MWVLFFAIAFALFGGGTWFASATWIRFSGAGGLAWRLIPLALTLGFILAHVLAHENKHPLINLLSIVCSVWMGFLSFAIMASLACWCCAGLSKIGLFPVNLRTVTLSLFALALVTTLYGMANARWLRVTQTRVSLPHLTDAWQGKRVVLISDLHLGSILGRSFAERIVGQINALNPEAVFICGDLLDGGIVDLDEMLAPLAQLKAPSGVFVVTGNHDEFRKHDGYANALRRYGARMLNCEKVDLAGLQILGVPDHLLRDRSHYEMTLQNLKIDSAKPSILLAHQPVNLTVPEKSGISLQLSGHTHEGQFWPWTLFVPLVHGRFSYGLNAQGPLQVLTSSGAGTWGPPIRVGTKSEIVLIELEAAPAGKPEPVDHKKSTP